jgi:hypothetical protein
VEEEKKYKTFRVVAPTPPIAMGALKSETEALEEFLCQCGIAQFRKKFSPGTIQYSAFLKKEILRHKKAIRKVNPYYWGCNPKIHRHKRSIELLQICLSNA